jgi:hypothetical protein
VFILCSFSNFPGKAGEKKVTGRAHLPEDEGSSGKMDRWKIAEGKGVNEMPLPRQGQKTSTE